MRKKKKKSPDTEKFLKKAKILIDVRRYKREGREDGKGLVDITVSKPESDEKVLIRSMTKSRLKSGQIGVDRVRKMKVALRENESVNLGILIGEKFTFSARKEAKKDKIELISRKSFPSFNIFEHEMVSKHEILKEKERDKLLKTYRIKPYEMPRIKASDPAVKIIGGKAGDIIKITRKSHTAGNVTSYRYVT
jgi:DNA-directed RNA polymerase subunit H